MVDFGQPPPRGKGGRSRLTLSCARAAVTALGRARWRSAMAEEVAPPLKAPIPPPPQPQYDVFTPFWTDPAWLAEPDDTTIGEGE